MSVKAATVAVLEADHERKTVAIRIPDLDVLNRTNDAAELHTTPDTSAPPHGNTGQRFAKTEYANPRFPK
jgi:hypothetical protein